MYVEVSPQSITDFKESSVPSYILQILRQIRIGETHVSYNLQGKCYDGCVEGCEENTLIKSRRWKVRFSAGLNFLCMDEEVLNMLVLHPTPIDNGMKMNMDTSTSSTLSLKNTGKKNILPEMMVHLLDTHPTVKSQGEDGKIRSSQQQGFCNLGKYCWEAMNKDGLKAYASEDGRVRPGRPQKKLPRCASFCRSCVGDDGKPLHMCPMCYAFTHTKKGIWKLTSSTIAENLEPIVSQPNLKTPK